MLNRTDEWDLQDGSTEEELVNEVGFMCRTGHILAIMIKYVERNGEEGFLFELEDDSYKMYEAFVSWTSAAVEYGCDQLLIFPDTFNHKLKLARTLMSLLKLENSDKDGRKLFIVFDHLMVSPSKKARTPRPRAGGEDRRRKRIIRREDGTEVLLSPQTPHTPSSYDTLGATPSSKAKYFTFDDVDLQQDRVKIFEKEKAIGPSTSLLEIHEQGDRLLVAMADTAAPDVVLQQVLDQNPVQQLGCNDEQANMGPGHQLELCKKLFNLASVEGGEGGVRKSIVLKEEPKTNVLKKEKVLNSILFTITISGKGSGLNVVAESVQPVGLYSLDLPQQDISLLLPDLPKADFGKQSDSDKRHTLELVYHRLALVPMGDDLELSTSALIEVPPKTKLFHKEKGFGSLVYLVSVFEEGDHMCITATHPTEGTYHTKMGEVDFRSISNFESLEKLSLMQKAELSKKILDRLVLVAEEDGIRRLILGSDSPQASGVPNLIKNENMITQDPPRLTAAEDPRLTLRTGVISRRAPGSSTSNEFPTLSSSTVRDGVQDSEQVQSKAMDWENSSSTSLICHGTGSEDGGSYKDLGHFCSQTSTSLKTMFGEDDTRQVSHELTELFSRVKSMDERIFLVTMYEIDGSLKVVANEIFHEEFLVIPKVNGTDIEGANSLEFHMLRFEEKVNLCAKLLHLLGVEEKDGQIELVLSLPVAFNEKEKLPEHAQPAPLEEAGSPKAEMGIPETKVTLLARKKDIGPKTYLLGIVEDDKKLRVVAEDAVAGGIPLELCIDDSIISKLTGEDHWSMEPREKLEICEKIYSYADIDFSTDQALLYIRLPVLPPPPKALRFLFSTGSSMCLRLPTPHPDISKTSSGDNLNLESHTIFSSLKNFGSKLFSICMYDLSPTVLVLATDPAAKSAYHLLLGPEHYLTLGFAIPVEMVESQVSLCRAVYDGLCLMPREGRTVELALQTDSPIEYGDESILLTRAHMASATQVTIYDEGEDMHVLITGQNCEYHERLRPSLVASLNCPAYCTSSRETKVSVAEAVFFLVDPGLIKKKQKQLPQQLKDYIASLPTIDPPTSEDPEHIPCKNQAINLTEKKPMYGRVYTLSLAKVPAGVQLIGQDNKRQESCFSITLSLSDCQALGYRSIEQALQTHEAASFAARVLESMTLCSVVANDGVLISKVLQTIEKFKEAEILRLDELKKPKVIETRSMYFSGMPHEVSILSNGILVQVRALNSLTPQHYELDMNRITLSTIIRGTFSDLPERKRTQVCDKIFDGLQLQNGILLFAIKRRVEGGIATLSKPDIFGIFPQEGKPYCKRYLQALQYLDSLSSPGM